MRPPYGDIDDRVRAISKAMGLTPIIWTSAGGGDFDTNDWHVPSGLSSQAVLSSFETILTKANALDTGFIVLSHDLYQQTVDLATGYIIPDALARGFHLENIISCLKKPLSEAYIETSSNSTSPASTGTIGASGSSVTKSGTIAPTSTSRVASTSAMQLKYISTLLALSPTVLGAYDVRPFKINLSSKLPHLKELVRLTKLPSYSVLGSSGAGISLSWLKARQLDWLNKYDWSKEEASLNKFNHSTVDIGNITLHFIHQRSSDPKAIPLLLTHGWPGSFYEFHNVITPLSNPGKDSNVSLNSALDSFHVIVPSLPGYGFSSPAPIGWNTNKTAELFDVLITKVLKYKTYVAAGGDWGSGVTWGIHNNHADNVRAVLYNGLLPQVAPTYEDIANDPEFANETATLTEEQKQRLNNNTLFYTSGNEYFTEQTTRPATVGLALYDNPVGQLAWIGEKFLEWSDPQYGVPPSTVTNNTILTAVSIYYLTGTFETSVNTYFQNPGGFSQTRLHASTDVPMGFAAYHYDLQYFPEFYLSKLGKFVYYAGKSTS
ncbi:hypothetical protein FRC07_001758, partial [Ceratobasidium sp. 392]